MGRDVGRDAVFFLWQETVWKNVPKKLCGKNGRWFVRGEARGSKITVDVLFLELLVLFGGWTSWALLGNRYR